MKAGAFARVLRARALGDVGRLTLGTVIAQAATVAVSPLLTRLYGPEAFGVFAVYLSAVVFLNSFASGRYEYAITLPERERDSHHLLLIVMLITAGVGGIALAAAIMFGAALTTGLGVAELHGLLWIIPLAMVAESARGAARIAGIRSRRYRVIAQNDAGQSIARGALQVGVGLFYPLATWLVVVDAATRLVAGVTLIARAVPGLARTARSTSARDLRRVARRFSRFPVLSAPATLLNSATTQLPAVFLLAGYSTRVAGLYALTQRVLGAPLSLLGKSIFQVYMGRAAERRRGAQPLDQLFRASLTLTLAAAVVLVPALALVGSYLVAPVFGDDWREAGDYLRILIPFYVLSFAASGVGPTLEVTERQDLHLVREVVRSSLVLGTLAWCIQRGWPVRSTLLAYSIVGSIGYVLFIGTAWTAVRHPRRRPDSLSDPTSATEG